MDLSAAALKRYDRVPHPFSLKVEKLYEIAGNWLDKCYGPYLSNSNMSDYDYVLWSLQPLRSPGLPWTMQHVYKCDYWNSPDSDFYAKYWERLATDDPIRSLCSVTIKEEVRPMKKIVNCDVRTIIAMDVNHIQAQLELFLQQNESLIATHDKHPIQLGLDIFNAGFHKLNAKMSRFGPTPCTLELDGKKFDGRFRYFCFLQIYKFRFRMLRRCFRTPENWKRILNLVHDLCFSPLVDVNGDVFSRLCGNPSGQGCTTPDNAFKNWMDIVVLWHLIMPSKYHNYEDFSNLLEMCICGDDINISVHPSIQDLFNIDSIKSVMDQIDMEYHFAADHFRHNYECTFLGHGYKLCDVPDLGHAMWLPVIDCERMRCNMLIDNDKQTIENTIVRACGLRNETFACDECRDWFDDLIQFLRARTVPDMKKPGISDAWKNFKTDAELWQLYTGIKPWTSVAA